MSSLMEFRCITFDELFRRLKHLSTPYDGLIQADGAWERRRNYGVSLNVGVPTCGTGCAVLTDIICVTDYPLDYVL